MAAIPKEKPPEGFTYLQWEAMLQQTDAARESFNLWQVMDRDKRLDWVLRFIGKDLAKLSKKDLLTDSYVLRSMLGTSLPEATPHLPGQSPGIPATKKAHAVVSASGEVVLGAMDIADLKKIQKRIAEGVRGLAGKQGFTWEIPGPKFIRVSRFNAPLKIGQGNAEVPQKLLLQWWWDWGDNQVARILHEVAGLLWTVGKNLRVCLWCEKPFVGQKRQVNCCPEHAQARRDKKKSEKAKARRRATP